MPFRRQTLQALRGVARSACVRVRVEGSCMEPALAPGSIVEVRAARFYWPGDVVVFATPAGALTVHRVIGWGPAAWTRPWRAWAVWTQADGASAPDAPVAPERLLGRVSGRRDVGARAAAALRLVRHLARRAASRALGASRRPASAA